MTTTFISVKWIKPLWEKLNSIKKTRKNEIQEISDIFDDPYILSKYYVQPKCQHHNPADYNEIEAISYVKSPVYDTINDFLRRDFLVKDGRNQMFILADAGMGKTSLLVMLKLHHLTSFWPKQYDCVLLKLGSDTIDKIKEIKNVSKTVLLLDALDEDPESFGRIESRLIEILSYTSNFKRVIISCRTQYFPKSGEDPFDRPGRVEIGGYVCPMIFLSLFDEEQVDEYLDLRFKDYEEKKQKSRNIIDKMDSLRFRPLLLSHIEDIIDSDNDIWNEYSIYYALVSAWLLREEQKLNKRKLTIKITKETLENACLRAAVFMQRNEKRYITVDELKELIEESPELRQLEYFDVGGRSLLNRNSNGDFRFSHYTTQEFMLACGILNGKFNDLSPPIRSTDQILFFINIARPNSLKVNSLDFENADLRKFNFDNIDLSGCFFNRTKLQGINLTNKDIKNSTLQETDLSNSILIGSNFSKTSLEKAIIVDANLSEAIFEGCNLRNAKLNNSDLTNTNFTNSDLTGADLSSCIFNGVIFNGAKLINTKLKGIDLKSLDLSEVDLSKADLGGARLTLEDLTDGKLNVKNIDFSLFNFKYVDLSKTDLSGVNFGNADLTGASLSRTKLLGANLSKVIIDNTDFTGAYYSDNTLFPESFWPYEHGLIHRNI